MITELSTMIPKSTAPIDSRLADLPWRYSTDTENKSASGIMSATMPGAGDVAQEDEQDQDHQAHADDQVVEHVVRRHVDQVGPLVEGDDLHPLGEQACRSLSSSIFSWTVSEVGSDFSYFRISTMPSTTSFSPLRPTTPSRGW